MRWCLTVSVCGTKAHDTRPKFSVQVTGTRISYQKLGSNSTMFCSIQVKSGTGMHDRVAKLLVRDSGTSSLDGNLGHVA